MYLKTDNIIFQGEDQICYSLYAGIKQGLPLSPVLFLFYVDDIFDFFQDIYTNTSNCIYEIIHLLVHADDATLIASSRALAVATLILKIKVIKACVVNSLLTNCEAFGNGVPKDLEKTYKKLLRCTFNVRTNTPVLTLFIESGFVPIRALIIARQLQWFMRYKDGLLGNTPRVQLYNRLLREPTDYIQHYVDICEKYSSVKEVYSEAVEGVKNRVREFAENGQYKYKIYTEMNPDLQKSPFIYNPNPVSGDIIKFRLGSHLLPIETGRWTRTVREHRLCTACGVLGDERHAIYQCGEVDRTGLILSEPLSSLWNNEGVVSLFRNLRVAKLID